MSWEWFSKSLLSPLVRLLSRLHYQRKSSYLCSLLGGSGRGSLTWREFGREWWSPSSPPVSAVSPLFCFCRASAMILATRSLSTLKWKVFNKIYWKNGYFNQKLFPIALELFYFSVPRIKTKIWTRLLDDQSDLISCILPSYAVHCLQWSTDDEPADWSSCSSGGAGCLACAVAVFHH